jgi:hypothetical protein
LQSVAIQINSIHIDINSTTHKMSDIGQIIADQIKRYASSDIRLGFYYENAFGYLYIHDTMSADISLHFIC